jgi:glycosyltransferase involved in cell wall biosynthesis
LPNKLFELIQAEIPVITSNQKTISKVVDNHEIGITLKQIDKESIIDALGEMSNIEARKLYVSNIQKIKKQYSYETQEVKILKVFS